MTVKEEILEILGTIQRDGMSNLIEWLSKSTFFTMPSSTRFHGNYDGGLAEHSLNVYKCLVKMCEQYESQFPEMKFDVDSIKLIALCHDFCKIDLYNKGFRNVKNDTTGQWEKKQVYEFDDKLGLGHGSASVYMLQSFIKLKREEALAIFWHMGAYSSEFKGGDFSMNSAKEQTPLVTLVQLADMWASDFMEITIK